MHCLRYYIPHAVLYWVLIWRGFKRSLNVCLHRIPLDFVLFLATWFSLRHRCDGDRSLANSAHRYSDIRTSSCIMWNFWFSVQSENSVGKDYVGSAVALRSVTLVIIHNLKIIAKYINRCYVSGLDVLCVRDLRLVSHCPVILCLDCPMLEDVCPSCWYLSLLIRSKRLRFVLRSSMS